MIYDTFRVEEYVLLLSWMYSHGLSVMLILNDTRTLLRYQKEGLQIQLIRWKSLHHQNKLFNVTTTQVNWLQIVLMYPRNMKQDEGGVGEGQEKHWPVTSNMIKITLELARRVEAEKVLILHLQLPSLKEEGQKRPDCCFTVLASSHICLTCEHLKSVHSPPSINEIRSNVPTSISIPTVL